VAVLYINNPIAGVAIVAASEALVSATRGGKKPLSVAFISNFAEALGVVVPIPTCAKNKVGNSNISSNNLIFISIDFNIQIYFAAIVFLFNMTYPNPIAISIAKGIQLSIGAAGTSSTSSVKSVASSAKRVNEFKQNINNRTPVSLYFFIIILLSIF
jgi:hypothetical protein